MAVRLRDLNLTRMGMGLILVALGLAAGPDTASAAEEPLILPPAAQGELTVPTFDLAILGKEELKRPLIGAPPEFQPDAQGRNARYIVRGQQVGIQIEENAFITPSTSVSWEWCKERGKVCIVQIELIQPGTNQKRYFGYGAGSLNEPAAGDPTVEIFVTNSIPSTPQRIERNLFKDMKDVLGWEQARIASVYLSPWDGEPGTFSDLKFGNLTRADSTGKRFQHLSSIGTGRYLPSKLPDYGAKHVERFDSSFEECAPGRNSGANEWSAFGAVGDRDFNAIGRDM
jgi:hypothetical protein